MFALKSLVPLSFNCLGIALDYEERCKPELNLAARILEMAGFYSKKSLNRNQYPPS